MKVLLEHALVTVALDEHERVVRYTRTATPARTLADAVEAFAAAERAIARLARAEHTLLCDVRAAPGNNDPAFEAGLAPVRSRFFRGFARVATLVRSASGLLQVQRLARDAGEDGLVFRDEQAALQYLRTGQS